MQVFDIDCDQPDVSSGVTKIDNVLEKKEYSDYLKSQCSQMLLDKSFKTFNYNSNSSVITSLESIIHNQKVEFNGKVIADKLWVCEKKSYEINQKRLKVDMKRSHLVLAHIEFNNAVHFFIVKMIHNNFYRDNSFERVGGVPDKDAILKYFRISYTMDGKTFKPYIIHIKDPSSAVFWKTDFLELKEKFEDKKNLKECFKFLKTKITSKFSKSYKDRDYLLNATQYYFNTEKAFDIVKYVDTIIKPYKPELGNIDMAVFSESIIKNAGKSTKFDTAFEIVSDDTGKGGIADLEYKIKDGVSIHVRRTADRNIKNMFKSTIVDGKKAIAIFNPDDEMYQQYEDND
jgi:hypothetical protein